MKMKAQSDQEPERFIKSREKTQFNYNIHQVTIEDPEGGTRTAYEYDYLEIEGKVTKAKVLKAMQDAELEENVEFEPSEVESQYNEAKSTINLSEISSLTYNQLDTYIENNVTDLASAKIYLKKLSKVVLAMLKYQNLS